MRAVSEIVQPVSFDAIASIPISLNLPVPNRFTYDFGEPPLAGIPGVRSDALGGQVLIPALAFADLSAALAPVEFVGTGSRFERMPEGGDVPLAVQKAFSLDGGFYDQLDSEEKKEAKGARSSSLSSETLHPVIVFDQFIPEPLSAAGDQ